MKARFPYDILRIERNCVIGGLLAVCLNVCGQERGERVFTLEVPAQRGRILAQGGEVLARSTPVKRIMLRVPVLSPDTPEAATRWLDAQWLKISKACPEAVKPDTKMLVHHFLKNRQGFMPVSDVLYGDGVTKGVEKPEFVEVQTCYVRVYPKGKLAAHATGYAMDGGRMGLEASMDGVLAGTNGAVILRCDDAGKCVARADAEQVMYGKDVYTTLNLEIQEAVEKALSDGGRFGGAVVVNAVTGDVFASASNPTFDPGEVTNGLNEELFVRLTNESSQPLRDRAAGSVYPPGSVMKPLVALAGLRAGCIDPDRSVPCGPELVIDGFEFRNWADWESGGFTLRAAITRSCNTYFFQAAAAIGDEAILGIAREFGFGQPFPPALSGAARAVLPKRIPTRGLLAEFVIGHGGVTVSPLEVAMSMAALTNGQYRPRARLVAEVKDAGGRDVVSIPPAIENRINVLPEHLMRIHSAMYSVVNHRDGTARDAHLDRVRIHGKTGTAEWSSQGALVNAVWFAGFVKDCDPPLAFAIVVEGKKGERIMGGKAAAPIAGQFLSRMFSNPSKHGIRKTGGSAHWEVDVIVNPNLKPGGGKGDVPSISGSGYSVWFSQPTERSAKGR